MAHVIHLYCPLNTSLLNKSKVIRDFSAEPKELLQPPEDGNPGPPTREVSTIFNYTLLEKNNSSIDLIQKPTTIPY